MKTIIIELPVETLLSADGNIVIKLDSTGHTISVAPSAPDNLAAPTQPAMQDAQLTNGELLTENTRLPEVKQQAKEVRQAADTQQAAGPLPIAAAESQRKATLSSRGDSLFTFMQEVIARLSKACKTRTSETYRTTLNSFRRYREGRDLSIAQLTADVALGYEAWLRGRGIRPNTSSFYMRILRAVYNRAVAQRLVTNTRPFADVYTGIARTTKRAVGIDTIRQLEALTLDDEPLRFARDMFMFSFYTQGMAFVDMARLKCSDIKGGFLVYHRQKTGQQVSIGWTSRMQQLVDSLPRTNDHYLLPIIRKVGIRERSQLRRWQYEVNTQLHRLSAMLGLGHELTMYVARHSWASIAQSISVPLEVISRGMGHSSEQTTRIYLTEIDSGRLAAANQRVMDLISNAPTASSLHPADMP